MTQLIETKKGVIEFSQKGSGIPVLFLHGGHSNCQETLFHKGFDLNKFRLITPSRPGYGRTPLSTNRSPKSASDLLIALLDHLNMEAAIVIGISAGGLTAIELAANYANRVKKLVLISAVTKRWMSEQDQNYVKGKKIFAPTVERYSWALFRLFYFLIPRVMAKIMFRELSTFQPLYFTKEEVVELRNMINKQRSFTGFVNDLDQFIEEGVIDKVICPTLILHSLNDRTVKLEHAHHAKTKIKNSILRTYNNRWGHLLWLGKEGQIPIQDTMNFLEKDGMQP